MGDTDSIAEQTGALLSGSSLIQFKVPASRGTLWALVMTRHEYLVTEMCVMTVVPSLVLVREVTLPHIPGSGSLPLPHDHTHESHL